MNSLSWLIYLANVCDNVDSMFGFLCVLSTITMLVGSIVLLVMRTIGDSGEGRDEAECRRMAGSLRKPYFAVVAAWLLFGTLDTITPNKDTIYAIAASEVGEEVLKSPEATKARQALSAWLDKQIETNVPKAAETAK